MLMGARASQVWKDDRAVPAYVAAKGGWRISYVILVCGRDLSADIRLMVSAFNKCVV